MVDRRHLYIILILMMLLGGLGQTTAVWASGPVGGASIRLPSAGQQIEGKAVISGDAFIEGDTSIWYYKLEYTTQLEQPTWHLIRRTFRKNIKDAPLASWETSLIDNGQYYLRITAVDQNGNFIESETIPVTVDNGPNAPLLPAPIEIDTPLNEAAVKRQVKILGSVTTAYWDRPPFNTQFQEFLNAGIPHRTFDYYKLEYSAGPNFDNWQLINDLVRKERVKGNLATWDTTTVENGEYALRLRLVLQSGNYVEEQIKVTVANDPPPTETVANITSPTSSAIVNSRLTVRGTAALDSQAHQFGRYILEYGAGSAPDTWTTFREGTFPIVAASLGNFDVATLDNGDYTLRLRVEDAEGNTVVSDEVKVAVDRPTETVAKIESPQPETTLIADIRVKGSATLDTNVHQLGRSVLEYGVGMTPTTWIEIGEKTRPLTASTLGTFAVADLENGDYILRLRIEDKEGNTIETDQILVTVAHPTETVATILSPQADDTLIAEISIKGQAMVDTRTQQLGRYVLEYGVGISPTTWVNIAEGEDPVIEGTLGKLDVTTLDLGEHTLRLRVEDTEGETVATDQIPVVVAYPLETVATIDSPPADISLMAAVSVKGNATVDTRSQQMGRYVLEYGAGVTPTTWIEIKEKAGPEIDGSLGKFVVIGLENGAYTLRLRVEDETGETVATDQVLVTVAHPTETVAKIDSPEPETSLAQAISIKGSATIDTTTYQLGRYVLEYGVGMTPTTWVEFSEKEKPAIASTLGKFDVTALENGPYTIRLRIEDIEGETIATDQVLVTVDYPIETVAKIESPEDKAELEGRISIVGTATVDQRSAQFGQYILEYGAGAAPRKWTQLADGQKPIQSNRFTRWDVRGLESGTYTLRLRVTDEAEETEVEDQIAVTIKNPPPPTSTLVIINVHTDSQRIRQDLKVQGTAALDSNAYTFGRYTMAYGQGKDPETWITIGEDTYPVVDGQLGVWRVADLENGPYTLRLQVEDAEGTLIQTDQKTVILDKLTRNLAEIIAPESGNIYGSRVDIVGTAALDTRRYDFGRYILAYGEGSDPTEWIDIKGGKEAKVDERLATWKIQKLEPGTYTLRLIVLDKSDETRAETREVFTLVSPEEAQVNIISPAADQTISKPVVVTGSAIFATDGPTFGQYRLEYDETGWPFRWEPIATGTTPIFEDTLGTWDITDLPDGDYNLRLVVESKSGKVSVEDEVSIRVEQE